MVVHFLLGECAVLKTWGGCVLPLFLCLMPMSWGFSAAPAEFIIEVRLIQQGRTTQVKMRTEPCLSNEATIYFETSEGTPPLDQLQLSATQGQIQEAIPSRFISTPLRYYSTYKRAKHQRLERIILEASGYVFAIKLTDTPKDGVYKLIVAASVDEDNDGAFVQTKTLKASRLLQFCPDYDSNAVSHPLQTEFFFTHRGDDSFDWNCNGRINLSKVKLGKPGKFEMRDGVCVEVIPPEHGWADSIPTQVGVIAHCFIVLGSGSSVDAFAPDDPLPLCITAHARCVQSGN